MEKELWEICYRTPQTWVGRSDSLTQERLFQLVKSIDLTQVQLKRVPNAVAFIGFASDEGVKRNLGRVGASEGPAAIRQQLANIAVHQRLPMLYDLGDITCRLGDLESAQIGLSQIVSKSLENGLLPVVIGGGHEVAWGHYQGIAQHTSQQKLGIINLDAHFDLRSCNQDGRGSSGSSFLQIAQARQDQGLDFSYLCLGIQPQANTKSLFKKADSLGVDYCEASLIYDDIKMVLDGIDTFLGEHDAIYLTLCMDVFAQAYAPGVSAPNSLGLTPQQVLAMLDKITKSGKVVSLDVAECSPPLDNDDATAKLAATMINSVLVNMGK